MKYTMLYPPLLLFLMAICLAGCDEEETNDTVNPDRSAVYNYFNEVALGSEFGNSSQHIRKWQLDMRIFLKGDEIPYMETELERIVQELNEIIEPITLTVVDQEADANYIVYLGSGENYASDIEPNATPYVEANLGFFWAYWDSNFVINRGSMYVDVFRIVDQDAQRHLLREELTQSLGLMNDSEEDPGSIFFANWTTTTEYAPIDRDLIELLYNTPIEAGMDATQVEQVLADLD
jgi:hypothetical protein